MKKLLLKSMLLLSALIVGSSSVWAASTSATLDMTKSQTSPVVVNGVTFSWTSSYIITGANSSNANGFAGKSGTADMTITIPSGMKLVGISKTNGNNWGSTNINVYTGTNSSGTLVTAISQGTNSYTISTNNTGTTYYLVNSASKNAWIQSLTIEYDDNSAVSTPSISGAENFLTSTEVSISCGTDGAAIQYSLDNGTSWTDYSASFILTETTTVKAKASKSGMTTSDVASKTFTKITPLTVTEALTAIDALADNGTIENQYVTGVVSQIDSYNSTYKSITYWISVDGTTTSQLEVYSGKGLNGADFSSISDLALGDIVVVSGTLKKYVDGTTITPEFTSNSQLFSLTKKVVTPSFSPAAGAVAANTEVTISTTTEGATIYYTTNGSTPTTSSNVYSAPITIDAAMTIKAFAVKTGHPDSDVATASYTIALPCATPTFSVAEGEVEKGTKVTISTVTQDATIYYTTNGSTPSTSSTLYNGEITINAAMTLKAIAVKDGLANSEVASVTYTLRDYAILPFSYDGGKSNLPTGLTQSGLGSDYTSKPYLKFDNTGDYLILKFAETPGQLSFTLKGNSMSGTYKFSVLESANGTDYTELEGYTSIGGSAFTETLNPKSTTRYIKWIYTTKANGNVGLGNINLTKTNTITLAEACTDGSKYYGTFSLGKAFVVPDGLTVSTVGVDNEGKLTITDYSTGDVVKANTGVLVSATTAGTKTVTVSAETGIENDGNLLKPSGDAGITAANMTVADTKFYRLTMHNGNEIGFWWGAADGAAFALAANKAYLAVPSAVTAREDLWFGDDATTVEYVKTQKADAQYYNLNGQKVQNPTKGLYIVNGKKVVIK